jgi:hypothetical protein
MIELVLVVNAEVAFEIPRRIHHPAVGEELLVPARAVHFVQNRGQNTARWLYGYAA